MEELTELPNFLSEFEIPDFKALCGVRSSLPPPRIDIICIIDTKFCVCYLFTVKVDPSS